MSKYNSVKIYPGANGWGDYIVVTPTDEKRFIVSMTGGGIDPMAAAIAEKTGAEADESCQREHSCHRFCIRNSARPHGSDSVSVDREYFSAGSGIFSEKSFG